MQVGHRCRPVKHECPATVWLRFWPSSFVLDGVPKVSMPACRGRLRPTDCASPWECVSAILATLGRTPRALSPDAVRYADRYLDHYLNPYRDGYRDPYRDGYAGDRVPGGTGRGAVRPGQVAQRGRVTRKERA